MIKRCIFCLMLSLCVISKDLEDLFNLNADDVIRSEIGDDFYEMRRRVQSIPKDTTTSEQNYTNLELNTTSKAPDVSTTEKILVATVPPEIEAKFANTTLREIKMQRFRRQLDRLLNTHRPLSDYLSKSDVETLTRQFDQMVASTKKIKQDLETRREQYDPKENWRLKWDAKTRYMNLITHFTYITRYKLVYPQLLRKKYLAVPTYKLGYLFALARHLKNMQKWLLWALNLNGQYVDGTIFYDLKIFEKIQRLDVDIKDVVLLIQKMEYKKNVLYNPKFYDYSQEIDYD